MQRNRRPLNPEHARTHLPMGRLILSRMKRLFLILAALLATQILIIWMVEDLTLFEFLYLLRIGNLPGFGSSRVSLNGCHAL